MVELAVSVDVGVLLYVLVDVSVEDAVTVLVPVVVSAVGLPVRELDGVPLAVVATLPDGDGVAACGVLCGAQLAWARGASD